MSDDKEGTDPRPLLLAAAAWAGAWLATSGDVALVVAGGVASVLGGAWAARRRNLLWGAVVLVLLAGLAGGGVRVWQQGDDPLRELARERAVATVEVRVQGGARFNAASGTRPAWWASRATVLRADARGRGWRSGAAVELSATGDAVTAWRALAPGTTVRGVVRLSEPDREAGLVANARTRGRPEILAPPGPVDRAVAAVRAGLRAACEGLAPEPRALVPALVVGDTSQMPDDLVARFKVTGLTHLTAVSGANLTLLLAFLRTTAVWAGVRGRWLTAVLAVGVAGFVVLCLGEPSVVRAAAMGLVGLMALGRVGRNRDGLRFLAAAVLGLVLIDPWLARSLGFVLSVTASAGLLWWSARWTRALSTWLPRWCAEAVAVPLAAQLATQPIVTAISGQVSVAGLIANAAAGPLVGPATVFGFLAAGLSVVSVPAASACAWVAGWCAQGLCWIARLGESLPGATRPWPASPAAVALVGATCLVTAWLLPWLLCRRWLCVGMGVALLASLTRTPAPPGWPPTGWAMVSCDVGQGDATVFDAGGGSAVVVDAGPDPGLLDACLASLNVRRVPLLVLTHLHADHVSGVPAVAVREPRLVVTSVVRTPAWGEALVQRTGGQRHFATAGEAWTVGQVRVDVLAAPARGVDEGEAGEGESSGENDASLLLKVTAPGLTALLAGDAEVAGQERMLALGDALDVDVLLVPHHGSSRQSPAFLASTRPELAVVSVGAGNDYGHPTAKTLRLVQGLGPAIARTDTDGAVAVSRAKGRLWVTTQR